MKKKLLAAFLCMLIACMAAAVLFACGRKAETYTVTYEKSEFAEAGTVPVDETRYKKDDYVSLQSPDGLTLENYHFVGWNDGEKTYALSDEYTMPDHDVTFTAVWQINKYTVTYMNTKEDFATAHVLAERYAAEEIITVQPNSWFPETDDRDFLGWLDDGGAAYVDGEAYIMPAHDVVFVCNWRIKYIKTYFYSEGEQIAVKNYAINYGDEKSVIIDEPPPTPAERDGYAFSGWFREGEDEPFTINYTNFTEDDFTSGTLYLYARWEQKYTVVYRQFSDGGKSYTDEKTYLITEPVELISLDDDWKVKGKDFLGWSVRGGEPLTPGTKYSITAEDAKTIVFTAVWEITSVTVTFYTDTTFYDEIEYNFSNPIELPDPPAEGFGGWFTKDGVEFNEGYVFTQQDKESGELAVYAKWLQPVKIVYLRNGNGTDVAQFEDPATYYEGNLVTLAALPSGWTVADKDFFGWEVGGVRYQPNQSFWLEENSDSTIYIRAIWNYTAFTIYYHYWNEGDETPLEFPVEQDAVIIVLEPDSTTFEGGVFFLGWYFENGEEFDNDYVFSNDDLDENGVLHVYGRWEHRYTIVYRQFSEDGESYTDERAYLITEPVELIDLPSAWEVQGKQFLGWSVNGGEALAARTNYSIKAGDPATIVFTAVWKIVAVKVTFYTDADEIYDTQYYDFNAPIRLPSAPTQAVFGGWFTEGGVEFNVHYAFTANDKQSGELAVYAKWLQPTKIVYQNGSEQSALSYEDPATYYEGDTVQLIEKPNGWTVADKGFFGWEVNGVRYTEGESFQIEGNEGGTVYIRAVWSEVAFTVYYYLNMGEEPYRIVLIEQGAQLTVLELDPGVFEEGATFLGWYFESGEELKEFNSDYVPSDEDFDENGVLHVYAMWNYPDVEEQT